MEDVRAWEQRPLDDVYPVLFLDCLVLKIRESGSVDFKGIRKDLRKRMAVILEALRQ